MAENKVTQMMDKQFTKTIEFDDMNGNKQTLKARLEEPSAFLAIELRDKLFGDNETSNWSGIFETLLDKVIVSPNLTFEDLNKNLDKELQTKELNLKNKNGKEVKVTIKFPNYRDAFDIAIASQKPTGGLAQVRQYDLLDEKVLLDSKGKHLKRDFWDKDGKGLIDEVMQQANKYIGDILDKDGLFSLLMYTFQYTQSAVTIQK